MAHSHFKEQGRGTIVFYSTHPVPCPCLSPGPVQCVSTIIIRLLKTTEEGKGIVSHCPMDFLA